MAFLTRFKIVSNDLLYYTSNVKPIKQWQFRQRAAYDALVASSMAMKLHFQAIGRYPAPVATCGTSEKSTLEPFIKQVISDKNFNYYDVLTAQKLFVE